MTNMDMGTQIVSMSLNECANLITQTVDDIQKLLKELHFYRHSDEGRYNVKMRIQQQQQRLAYLEDAYTEILKMKGE